MTNMVGFDIYMEDPGALRTVLIFIILLVLKYANTSSLFAKRGGLRWQEAYR